VGGKTSGGNPDPPGGLDDLLCTRASSIRQREGKEIITVETIATKIAVRTATILKK
jgi:hypothetical protein